MRLTIFLAVALLLFLPFNLISIRQVVRFHPGRRRLIYAAAILGNLVWPLLPRLDVRNDVTRLLRALFGPPWFAWLCFVILYSFFILLVLLAWLPFRRRATFQEFAHRASTIFLTVSLVAVVIGVYQALVPLRIEHVPVRLKNLPAELNGTKLVLITDLHTGLFTRPSRLQSIFATAVAQKPAAILLAGDLIDDDSAFAPKLLAGARDVPASIPLIATLGNHETYGQPFEYIQRMKGSRVRLLVNEGMSVGRLWVCGLSDYAAKTLHPTLSPNLDAALIGKPRDAFAIVVAHQPKAFADARQRGIALTLCGHTHGGQLGFRPLHLTLAGLFLPYDMGLYQEHGAQLYVSTGTGYWLLPFRLGMTPELTVVELVAE